MAYDRSAPKGALHCDVSKEAARFDDYNTFAIFLRTYQNTLLHIITTLSDHAESVIILDTKPLLKANGTASGEASPLAIDVEIEEENDRQILAAITPRAKTAGDPDSDNEEEDEEMRAGDVDELGAEARKVIQFRAIRCLVYRLKWCRNQPIVPLKSFVLVRRSWSVPRVFPLERVNKPI